MNKKRWKCWRSTQLISLQWICCPVANSKILLKRMEFMQTKNVLFLRCFQFLLSLCVHFYWVYRIQLLFPLFYLYACPMFKMSFHVSRSSFFQEKWQTHEMLSHIKISCCHFCVAGTLTFTLNISLLLLCSSLMHKSNNFFYFHHVFSSLMLSYY